MKRIVIFSKYGMNGSSSRIRLFSLIPYLDSEYKFVVNELLNGPIRTHVKPNHFYNIIIVIIGYIKRFIMLLKLKKDDIVLIQYELFPYFPSIFEYILKKIGVRYIVDYDDATFHYYDEHPIFLVRKLLSHKIGSVMRNSAIVFAGNKYLMEYARKAGAERIEIIPTLVHMVDDKVSKKDNKDFIVGWIGSPSTTKYLEVVIPVFRRIKQKYGKVRFLAIGASNTLTDKIVEIIPWRLNSESELIQSFDIGIMPLDLSKWSKGKCGYKLLQYLANKIPVIASPVGVNNEIVTDYMNGFLANNEQEWFDYIEWFILHNNVCNKMGENGYEYVKKNYSYQSYVPIIREILAGFK